MLILEQCLKKEGVDNEIENKRRSKRLAKAMARAGAGKIILPNFLSAPKRPSQRSVKFIRWLRNHLFSNTSWMEAMGSQRGFMLFFKWNFWTPLLLKLDGLLTK